MIVKEPINKLNGYNGDLFVIMQTHCGISGYDFALPKYSIITDVFIEEDSLVMLSDSKCFIYKPSVTTPMTVKEVINELSKYSPDLEVSTGVFDSAEFLLYGIVESIVGDIVKVFYDEVDNAVVLSDIE